MDYDIREMLKQDAPMVCPNCGKTHVEVNTQGMGDYPWFLCADCGWCWQ